MQCKQDEGAECSYYRYDLSTYDAFLPFTMTTQRIATSSITSIMSSSSNQYICVGTKRISIEEEEYGGDACISIFRLRPPKQRSSSTSHASTASTIEGRDWRSPSPRDSYDGNSTVDDCLHLMATDGEHTFYKR